MKAFEISKDLQVNINRTTWIEALKKSGDRQIHSGVFFDQKNCICAAGLAMELATKPYCLDVLAAIKFLGICYLADISVDNDTHKLTFKQIAAAAEKGKYW